MQTTQFLKKIYPKQTNIKIAMINGTYLW